MMKKAIVEFKDFSFKYKTQTETTLKNINLLETYIFPTTNVLL